MPIREQIREAAILLLTMALTFPPIFMLADVAMYGV